MQIYHYDYAGYYLGAGVASESPMEPGEYLIPARATTIEPPETDPGFVARWVEDEWYSVPVPATTPESTDKDVTYEEMIAEIEAQRLAAFQKIADPKFFEWQAGEGTEAEWLAARESVRQMYPYPVTE